MVFDFASHRRVPSTLHWDEQDDRLLSCEAQRAKVTTATAGARLGLFKRSIFLAVWWVFSYSGDSSYVTPTVTVLNVRSMFAMSTRFSSFRPTNPQLRNAHHHLNAQRGRGYVQVVEEQAQVAQQQ
jgi:hypothetical protein